MQIWGTYSGKKQDGSWFWSKASAVSTTILGCWRCVNNILKENVLWYYVDESFFFLHLQTFSCVKIWQYYVSAFLCFCLFSFGQAVDLRYYWILLEQRANTVMFLFQHLKTKIFWALGPNFELFLVKNLGVRCT